MYPRGATTPSVSSRRSAKGSPRCELRPAPTTDTDEGASGYGPDLPQLRSRQPAPGFKADWDPEAAMETTHRPYSPIETDRLRDWVATWIGASWIWYAKLLSGIETSATQTRQPGPCIPRNLLKPAFPSLAEGVGATGIEFDIEIDSHGVREDRVRGVPHVGEGLLGRPQAQIRITNLGTASPLRDPENTGALTIFVFRPGPGTDSTKCRVWICRNLLETDVADDLIGPVEPGIPVPWGPA